MDARQKGPAVQQHPVQQEVPPTIPSRRGAIGKALIVWLASGSVGLAIVAFLLFRGMGC